MKAAVEAAGLLAEAHAKARTQGSPVRIVLRPRSQAAPILDPSDLPNAAELLRCEVRLLVCPDGTIVGPCGEVSRRWVEGMLELLDR